MSSQLDTLDPAIRPFASDLYDLARSQGLYARITSTRRSHAQQEVLYRRYQEGLSRYPAAVPGNSAHEYGLAFDMVISDPGYQRGAGKLWVSWGGVYGNEEDPIHFEYPSWRRVAGVAPTPTEASPANNLRTLVLRAEDAALSWLPTPLRYIIDIGSLGDAILEASGRSPSLLLYWLAHPAEFFDAFYQIVWSLALQSLRKA